VRGTGSNRSLSRASSFPDHRRVTGWVISRYLRTLRGVDQWFFRVAGRHSGKIQCGRGCAACCRGLFDITLLDALLVRHGFLLLDPVRRDEVMARCLTILETLRQRWPEISPPYILNILPEAEWDRLMPDDDETPCVFLDENGGCLIYAHRPMTCRLHGVPLIDRSGEVVHDEWCTLNFPGCDPLSLPDIRAPFLRWFGEEVELLETCTGLIMGRSLRELDTFIPLAPLVSLDSFDWKGWLEGVTLVRNDPLP